MTSWLAVLAALLTGWVVLAGIDRALVRSDSVQLFGEIVSRVETTEPLVALTFDDGPTAVMLPLDEILEMLATGAAGSIILLHIWFPARRTSLDAVPDLIDEVEKQGFRFVTLSELLREKTPNPRISRGHMGACWGAQERENGAGGRNRTDTRGEPHWILSPARLPVSPLRRRWTANGGQDDYGLTVPSCRHRNSVRVLPRKSVKRSTWSADQSPMLNACETMRAPGASCSVSSGRSFRLDDESR